MREFTRVLSTQMVAFWLLAEDAYVGIVYRQAPGVWVGVRFGDGGAVRASTRQAAVRGLRVLPPRTVSPWGVRYWWALRGLRKRSGPLVALAQAQATLAGVEGVAYARFVVVFCRVVGSL